MGATNVSLLSERARIMCDASIYYIGIVNCRNASVAVAIWSTFTIIQASNGTEL